MRDSAAKLIILIQSFTAAAITFLFLFIDLFGYSQLVFGTRIPGLAAAGYGNLLLTYLVGSTATTLLRRGTPITVSFIGAAAVVQAALVAAIADRLDAAGILDPAARAGTALLACGVTTFVTGLVFVTIGAARTALAAQLLPHPVVCGYLGGVGLLFVQGGLSVGSPETAPPQVLATAAAGVATFALPRLVRHWAVYPAVIAGAVLAMHGLLHLLGLDAEAAQAAGWFIERIPDGALLDGPGLLWHAVPSPAMLAPVLPALATHVVVAVIVQVLYVLDVEHEWRRDLDLDRTFVATGVANLLGGGLGGLSLGFGRTTSVALHANGGGNRLGVALTILAMALLLLGGGDVLGLLPRAVAGGALLAVGIGLLVRFARQCRALPLRESAVALTVCAAASHFGTVNGFGLGLLLAALMFAIQYGRVPAVRAAWTGSERRSSVIRASGASERLAREGGRTRVIALHGYLFFLNARAVRGAVAAVAGAQPDLRTVIIDFGECVGFDSSALVVFRKVDQLARERGFDVLLVGLDAEEHRRFDRDGLLAGPRMRAAPSLDAALQEAEASLLAALGITPDGTEGGFARRIGEALGCAVPEADLQPYTTEQRLRAGEVLVRQGEEGDAAYFVESGLIAIDLDRPGRGPVRLRTTAAGTLLGEVSLARGGPRTASVVAVAESRVAVLTRDALARMEREHPSLAAMVQRFLILELASKLADTNHLLDASVR